MDFNDLLLSAMLIRGRFDTKTIHESKFRVYMNHVLAFIQLFCAIKMSIVLVMPWNEEAPLLFYLVEFFVFPNAVQLVLFVAVAGIHLHIAYIYWKWGQLSADANRLHYLKMLFMSDIGRLCSYYDLPLNKTGKLLQRIKVYKIMAIVFIIGFELCFALLVGRCLYFSYMTLPISHFVSITLPMGAITLFSYHWLANGFLISKFLALVTIEFLGLRINTIGELIEQKYPRRVSGKQHRRKKDSLKVQRGLNDIVKQYYEANQIFDSLISPTFVNCLMGALVYPSFIFFSIPYIFKVFIIVLYLGVLIINCAIIVIFNEGFMRNASLTTHRTGSSCVV